MLTEEQNLRMKQLFAAVKKRRMEYAKTEFLGKQFFIKREGKKAVETILHYPVHEGNQLHLPVFINLHGGAWLAGDARCMESFCQNISHALQILVVNVNYTKVDVQTFPYATDEVVDVVKFLMEHDEEMHIDPNKIVIGGCSAGGQITATAVLKLKDEGIKLAGQLLVYPVTKLEFEEEELNLLTEFLFPNGGYDHPYISPLLASDKDLEGICQTSFIICGMDTLKEMGLAYAKRLQNVQVSVDCKVFPNALHGFIEVNQSEHSNREIGQDEEQQKYAKEATAYIISEIKKYVNNSSR